MLAMGSAAVGQRGGVSPESPIRIDADFHGWLLDQAAALRREQFESIDWQHIAEELETMAAGERRTLKKQLKRLMLHLLKMGAQSDPLNRHGGWRRSIRDAREELEDLVDESPGIFQGKTEEVVSQAFERARSAASEETKLPLEDFPDRSPWSFEEMMRKDFFPGSSQSN